MKSGTSFGTEEEDDGHLSDFDASAAGDSDRDGTIRHGTYVVQPYSNSNSRNDRSSSKLSNKNHRCSNSISKRSAKILEKYHAKFSFGARLSNTSEKR